MRGLELKIPPPVVAGIFAALMWALDWAAPALSLEFPGRLVLAWALAGAGLLLDLVAASQFFRARTTLHPMKPQQAKALVVRGVYRWTRNPMYLGQALVLAGWGAYLANPLSILGVPAFVAYLTRFQIVPEERVLESLFGEAFARYRERVRRWL